ncbi:MAG: hypothetical protein Ct9H300mP9_6490 [Candidatus Neomarinimicrobiota bacterium]|nr:MAG: hypothetical protein Ct9H300mP9_6490 [Candidatus Neomarinimicrobiota bacterium]
MFGEDINEIKDDIKTQIDAITSFPDGSEKPIVRSLRAHQRSLQWQCTDRWMKKSAQYCTKDP